MNSKLQYQAVQSSCEGIICLIILMATHSKAVCCFSNTSKKTNKPNLNLSSALTCSGCTDSKLYSAKSYLVVLQIHIFHQWQFLPIQWFCQPNVRWGPSAVWNETLPSSIICEAKISSLPEAGEWKQSCTHCTKRGSRKWVFLFTSSTSCLCHCCCVCTVKYSERNV